jgi:hypothetical protein
MGAELRGSGGNAASFGFVGEALWRGRIGGFAGLLSTSGVIENPPPGQSNIPDRISAPFGLAARPFAVLVEHRGDYLGRLAQGVWVQLGVTIENLRTSDENQTVAGFHGAVGMDVPIWGGPVEGGVVLRVNYRMVAAPEVHLHAGESQELFAPKFSSQIFAGLAYFP